MSDDERATIHRRTPGRGIPMPFSEEEVTGQHEGEELLEMRRRRAQADPASRIALLETEQKEQAAVVNEIRLDVTEIKGDQKAQNASLAGIEKTLDRMAQREHVTFTAKVDVETAEKIDVVNARTTRRNTIAKIIAALIGGGGIVELVRALL